VARAVHHLKAARASSTPSLANRATKAAERFSISMGVEVRPPRFWLFSPLLRCPADRAWALPFLASC
jgi:hypothetical protein